MFMFYRRDLLPLTVYSICIGMPSAYRIRVFAVRLVALAFAAPPRDMRLQHGWVGWGWSMPCIVLGSFFGYVVGTLTADWLVGHRSVYIWEQAPATAALSLTFMVAISLIVTVGFYSYFRMQTLQCCGRRRQRQAAEARLVAAKPAGAAHALQHPGAPARADQAAAR